MSSTWVFVVRRSGCDRKAQIVSRILEANGYVVRSAPLPGVQAMVRNMRCHCERTYQHRSVSEEACPKCRKVVIVGLFSEADFDNLAQRTGYLGSHFEAQMERSNDELLIKIARRKRTHGWDVQVCSYIQSVRYLLPTKVPVVNAPLLAPAA